MAAIRNDEAGIFNPAVYETVHRQLYPGLLGKLFKGISEQRAAKIKSLVLRDCGTLRNLDFLRFFPGVEALTAEAEAIGCLQGLEHCPGLASVSLMSPWLDGVDLSPLAACKGLREVELMRPAGAWGAVEVRGLEALKELPVLECLWLPRMGLHRVDFVADLTGLRDLELAGNPLEDLSPLEGHPALEELDLTGCGLREIGFVPEVPHLRQVYLDENPIEDFAPLLAGKLTYVSGGDELPPRDRAEWKVRLQERIETVDFELEQV